MTDDDETQADRLGPPAWTGQHTVLTGSCSWTDQTLVEEADWYPRRTMSRRGAAALLRRPVPADRDRLDLLRAAGRAAGGLWAERTPDGFRFDVKAYSLLTGHPTRPRSLWRDLREQLPPDVAEKRNIYAKHLDPGGDRRGVAAVRGGAAAAARGRQARRGAVPVPAVVRARGATTGRRSRRCASACPTTGSASSSARRAGWPRSATASGRWACSRSTAWCSCASTRRRSPACRGCWRSPTRSCSWCASTDARTAPGPTPRARRRSAFATCTRRRSSRSSAADRRARREARETHLLMNNCYRDYAVRNAAQLRDLLAG